MKTVLRKLCSFGAVIALVVALGTVATPQRANALSVTEAAHIIAEETIKDAEIVGGTIAKVSQPLARAYRHGVQAVLDWCKETPVHGQTCIAVAVTLLMAAL